MATRIKKTGGRTSTEEKAGSLVKADFRKSNDAIGLRITEGRLTLLSRKLFNIMVAHAQDLKTPGQNAPLDTEAAKKYFWVPLSDIAHDADYASNDTELLKGTLEEFMNIKIHLSDERQWTSERLISSVKIVNTSGLGNRGGTVWFGYAFPPEVSELVMSPKAYTKLSIYYQGLIRSGSTLALYEVCRRYATNPSHVTGVHTYDYWYGVLTGNPVRDEPPPYKYFKRDILKSSIAEINSITDIDVELIEHKNGRKVESLQFRVDMKRQPSLDFPAQPVINSAMIDRIVAFGIARQAATDLTTLHPFTTLMSAIDLVEKRLSAAGLSPLDSPGAYFRWALTSRATGESLPKIETSPKVKKVESNSLIERFLSARARDAFEVFCKLNDEEKALSLESFKDTLDGRAFKGKFALTNPMAKSLIGRWYAHSLWGEPTAVALSTFSESNDITAE